MRDQVRKTTWEVEKSYKVAGPDRYRTTSLNALRVTLQKRADRYIPDPDNGIPPLGELTFQYELDDNDQPVVIRAYFYNRHGDKDRFMRLRRIDE